ncbi:MULTISPECIES: hypothetical protein [Flavobacteriaceae]|nr:MULTISPECIES: hypothetical protein [Flavobacteriaceae]
MKKTFDILLILLTIGVVAVVGITIFGVSIMGKRADIDNFKKQKTIISETSENRILYTYGLDTVNWEKYVFKRKVELILTKTELDSTIFFNLIGAVDSSDTFGSTQFVKIDSSLYILGDKHHIIEKEKYFNEDISKYPFDLYDLVNPYPDANGSFLFNSDYGTLNVESWSAGKQLFYLPINSKVDIEKELLRN